MENEELKSCPNADEPEALYMCECCSKDIFAGDSYLDVPWCGMVCEECMNDMDTYDLADFLGLPMSIAGEEKVDNEKK